MPDTLNMPNPFEVITITTGHLVIHYTEQTYQIKKIDFYHLNDLEPTNVYYSAVVCDRIKELIHLIDEPKELTLTNEPCDEVLEVEDCE